ncbi:hypothetical protein QBC32DRAFT_356619, partial [Pseudoneurospora amorphoporcata]
MVFGACELEVSMPVLLNRPGVPLSYREPPAEFETIVFRLSRHPFDPKYQVEQATYYILESGHHEYGL